MLVLFLIGPKFQINLMDDKGVFIMLGSAFGTVYRSVFTPDFDSVKKFFVSLILSIIGGFAMIEYCKENEIKNHYVILVSLLLGYLIHPISQIILAVSTRSQASIVDNAAQYIDEKTRNLLNIKKEDKKDGTDIG